MAVSWFQNVRALMRGADGARTQRGGAGYPSPPEGQSPARAAAPPPATRRRPVDSLVGWLIRLGLVARG